MSQYTNKEQFYKSAEEEQIAGLSELAAKALEAYGLSGAEISKLAYRENMTFAIDAGAKGKFALRVHQAAYRTDAQVQSELDYMEYLNGVGIATPQVIHAHNGHSFVNVSHPSVPETRQCDLFEWIEGGPLRKLFEPPSRTLEETAAHYLDAGRLLARIYNAGENWSRRESFNRLDWDIEGILSPKGLLGDFRKSTRATDAQRKLLDDLVTKISIELDAFGKSPDRYGLCQGDMLPENLMVTEQGLRIIDFDDAGNSWVMFEIATAFWDITESEYFEPCFGAFVTGFREHRELADEHLAMLPTFIFARMMSYLAHTVSREHLDSSAENEALLLGVLEHTAPDYLKS